MAANPTGSEETLSSYDDDDARIDTAGAPAGHGLTRVTINLRRPTVEALDRLVAANGSSRTDNVNKAIHVLAVVHDIMTRNGGRLTVLMDNGDIERVHIL